MKFSDFRSKYGSECVKMISYFIFNSLLVSSTISFRHTLGSRNCFSGRLYNMNFTGGQGFKMDVMEFSKENIVIV